MTGVSLENVAVPARFTLGQNTPNPFNPVTSIQFEIAKPGPAAVRIFSVNGRLVRVLVERPFTPGQYRVRWDGRDERGRPVASGVYVLEATSGGERLVRKITALK